MIEARRVAVGDRVVPVNGTTVRPALADEPHIGVALEVLDDEIIGAVVHVGMYRFIASFLDATNPRSRRPLARFEEQRAAHLLGESRFRAAYY